MLQNSSTLITELVPYLLRIEVFAGIAIVYILLKIRKAHAEENNRSADPASIFLSLIFVALLAYVHQSTPVESIPPISDQKIESPKVEPQEPQEQQKPQEQQQPQKIRINQAPSQEQKEASQEVDLSERATEQLEEHPSDPNRISIDRTHRRPGPSTPNLAPQKQTYHKRFEPQANSSAPTQSLAPLTNNQHFGVQVGSYASKENAQQITSQFILEMGEPAVFYQDTDQLFKVIVGDFPEEESARVFALENGLKPIIREYQL